MPPAEGGVGDRSCKQRISTSRENASHKHACSPPTTMNSSRAHVAARHTTTASGTPSSFHNVDIASTTIVQQCSAASDQGSTKPRLLEAGLINMG